MLEKQQEAINQKILNGEELTDEDQKFLKDTQGANKAEKMMQGIKQHMKDAGIVKKAT